MAINARGWVLGALVRFGDLRFILQGGLDRIYSPECAADFNRSTSQKKDINRSNTIAESLQGLRQDPSSMPPCAPDTPQLTVGA